MPNINPELFFNDKLIFNIKRNGNNIAEFCKYTPDYRFITETTHELNPGEFSYEEHIRLIKPQNKICKGKRHHFLYARCVLRRVMMHDNITKDQLLFNLWMDRLLCCDDYYSITLDEAMSIVIEICRKDLEDIVEQYSDLILKASNKFFVSGKGTDRTAINQQISKEVKKATDQKIRVNFNHELTAK